MEDKITREINRKLPSEKENRHETRSKEGDAVKRGKKNKETEKRDPNMLEKTIFQEWGAKVSAKKENT